MAGLQDINGVGPARSKSLKDAGYESPEDLVDADPEAVAEHAGISEDNALETIVQAQNMVEDNDASETQNESENEAEPEAETISDEIGREIDAEPRESDEEVEEASSGREGESANPDEELGVRGNDGEVVEEGVDDAQDDEEDENNDGPFQVTLDFDSREQFDVFHAALVEHWRDSYDTRVDSSLMRDILDSMENFDKVEMELSRNELNNLHSALHQERINYQGSNQVEQLNLIRDTEQRINEVREEELF